MSLGHGNNCMTWRFFEKSSLTIQRFAYGKIVPLKPPFTGGSFGISLLNKPCKNSLTKISYYKYNTYVCKAYEQCQLGSIIGHFLKILLSHKKILNYLRHARQVKYRQSQTKVDMWHCQAFSITIKEQT